MLYRIFKWLFTLTVNGYFRSIYTKGLEQIPDEAPLIFVANHNSAFMDPIVLAVHLKQSIYFLARGESFKSKLASTLFRLLHMIPIYKPEISPDEVYKNKFVFQKCYDHLKKGKSILIFPEGISETVRNLRKIKTGAARIGLGAENENNFNLKTKIVPIGINYSNPHYFRSDVFINVGKPIEVSKYAQEFEIDEKNAVKELTNEIREHLEDLIVIVKDEKLDKLIKQIEILFRSELRSQKNTINDVSRDFYLSQKIVEAVEYYQDVRPEYMVKFKIKINKYLSHLKQLKIRDSQIKNPNVRLHLVNRLLYFIFGLPIFLYGFLVNIIPFKAAEYLSKKILVRKDFIGSMKLAFGMFIFLIFYIIQIIVLGSLAHWFWVVVFGLTLYPAGLFTISYLKNYFLVRGNLRYLYLLNRKSDLISDLKQTRQELMNELEEGRQLYINLKRF